MAFEESSEWGRDFFWAVFAVMALTSLCFLAFTLRSTKTISTLGARDHLHHYCTWIIVTTAAIAYYAMAADSGYKYVKVHKGNYARTIYYARYIDWSITTPLLLLDLILLGHLTIHHTARVIFCDVAMILCGLFGALLSTGYKWGFFAMGCVFMLIIFWDLLISIRGHVNRRDATLGTSYTFLALWLIVLWAIYPIIWGLCEGSNTISVNAEIVSYGILDVLAKVVFGTLLLLSISRHRAGIAKSGGVPIVGARQTVAPGTGGVFNHETVPAAHDGVTAAQV